MKQKHTKYTHINTNTNKSRHNEMCQSDKTHSNSDNLTSYRQKTRCCISEERAQQTRTSTITWCW